jgi:hypothetical protein
LGAAVYAAGAGIGTLVTGENQFTWGGVAGAAAGGAVAGLVVGALTADELGLDTRCRQILLFDGTIASVASLGTCMNCPMCHCGRLPDIVVFIS